MNTEENQKKELEKSSSKHKDSNQIHSIQEDDTDDKTDQENLYVLG